MGNIIFATPDWSDSATLTPSQEETAAPAANLQKLQPTDLWRTNNLTGISLEADRGSSQLWNLVALLFTNATSAATWQVRADDSQANLTTTPAYDSGAIGLWASSGLGQWARTHSLLWVPAGVTTRFVRIDVTDAANPDGKLTVGRLYISKAFQPAFNIDTRWTLKHVHARELRPPPGGPAIANVDENVPVLEFTLGWLDETEALNDLFEINRLRAGRKDVLVALDPDPSAQRAKTMVYGILESRGGLRKLKGGKFEISYRVTGLP